MIRRRRWRDARPQVDNKVVGQASAADVPAEADHAVHVRRAVRASVRRPTCRAGSIRLTWTARPTNWKSSTSSLSSTPVSCSRSAPLDFLHSQFGSEFERAYKQPLRTVARHVSKVEIAECDLPAVRDGDDVMLDMVNVVQGEDPNKYAGKTDDLNKEAQRRLAAMPDEQQKKAFRLRASKVRAGDKLGDPELFRLRLNSLIRRYMQRFNDFFVEEVTLHQLAAQHPLIGVFIHVTCDGELLFNRGRIGKAPPIMFRPWAVHPQPEVDQFKDDLQKGVPADSVSLLEVRARGFLERGARLGRRSSKCQRRLDLGVTRKLRQGFAKQGKSATDIDTILKGEINFKERANKLMHQATGKRVADLDTKLYMAVLGHRNKTAHGIAHADVEPSQQEAVQAIQDFERLRKVVEGIPV